MSKWEIPRLRKKYSELIFSMIADQDKHDHMAVELYNALLLAEKDLEWLRASRKGLLGEVKSLTKRLHQHE